MLPAGCVWKGWSQWWLSGIHSQFHWVYLVWLHANYMHWALRQGSFPKTQLVGLFHSWFLSRAILCHLLFARRLLGLLRLGSLTILIGHTLCSAFLSLQQVMKCLLSRYTYMPLCWETVVKKYPYTWGVTSQVTSVDLVFHRGGSRASTGRCHPQPGVEGTHLLNRSRKFQLGGGIIEICLGCSRVKQP